jgi:hypothetical protein
MAALDRCATWEIVWESLVDYGRLERQHTLVEVERQLDIK